MLLAVDIGNTRVKWGVFEGDTLTRNDACVHAELAQSALWTDAKSCRKAMIANVADEAIGNHVQAELQKLGLATRFAQSSAQACGVLNGYKMPKNLGIDRWAALIGARQRVSRTALVVNAGTAITVDALLVADGGGGQATFAGGMIMPGLTTMRQALFSGTAALKGELGDLRALPMNTEDAIGSGLLNAAVGAVERMAHNVATEANCAPEIVVTGGSAVKLCAALKFYGISATLAENLVLYGLNLLESENS